MDVPRCSYGVRGSLTATCVNANPSLFKTTSYSFDHLDETLVCKNCTLTVLEAGTFDLSGNQIKNLILQKSMIEAIRARAFVGLLFMEHLDLSNNELKNVVTGTFFGVKKIKTLNLSNNKIANLSENAFTGLRDLKVLNLTNNSISNVHELSFDGLESLVELDLGFNEIINLSGLSVDLPNLEVLRLRQNHLMCLPNNVFYNLTSLRYLDLSWNKLKCPLTMLTMKPGNSLAHLDLSRNAIDILIPNMFSSLNNLQELNLSYNYINDILLRTFFGLFNLVKLDITYNKLTLFRTGIYSGLPHLRELNLSHNLIDEVLVTGTMSLHNLHSLDLSYNSLDDILYFNIISRMPRLSYLDLQGNRFPCKEDNEIMSLLEFNNDNFHIVWKKDGETDMCFNEKQRKPSLEDITQILVDKSTAEADSTTAETSAFVLISIMILLLAAIMFMQYRNNRILGHLRIRGLTTSTINLVRSSGVSNSSLKD